MDDDSIAQRRVLIDEKAIRSLLKTTIRTVKTIETNENEEAKEELLRTFQAELDSFRSKLIRHYLVSSGCTTQIQSSSTTNTLTQAQIDQAKEDIIRLKKELEDAKLERQKRIQYDDIAKRIFAVNSRQTSEANIKLLNAQIESLRSRIASYDDLKRQRLRAYQGILTQMREYREVVNEDSGAGGWDEDVANDIKMDTAGVGRMRVEKDEKRDAIEEGEL